MSDTLLDARCEAVTETAEAILKAAGNSLMRHGCDHNTSVSTYYQLRKEG